MRTSATQQPAAVADMLVDLLEPHEETGGFTYSRASFQVIEDRIRQVAQSYNSSDDIQEIKDLTEFFVTEGNAVAAGTILKNMCDRLLPSERDLLTGKSFAEPSMRRTYGDLIRGPRMSLEEKFAPQPKHARSVKAGYLSPLVA